MKERELINVCTCITQDEVHRLIEEDKKNEFRSQNRVNRLMVGRVEEVRKETKNIWKKIIMSNPLYYNGAKKDETSHPVDQEGIFGDQKDEN